MQEQQQQQQQQHQLLAAAGMFCFANATVKMAIERLLEKLYSVPVLSQYSVPKPVLTVSS